MWIELLCVTLAARALAADTARRDRGCGQQVRDLPPALGRHQRLESLANSSLLLLVQYVPWTEQVYNKYPKGQSKKSYAHKSSLFSSPLRMFMTTIVVPIVTFIAVFIYVIFYTGSSDEIPYEKVSSENSATSVVCT